MANTIKCISVDPSIRNFGITLLDLDLDSLEFNVLEMVLVETAKTTAKKVRQNSDDLRRGQEIDKVFRRMASLSKIAFAEIPSGAQSARASFTLGMATGIIATCPVPLIQVMPTETKLATVGSKTASKEEIIAWAMAKYPKASWITRKLKGEIVVVGKNEHLADALAIAEAGVLTDEFARLHAALQAMR